MTKYHFNVKYTDMEITELSVDLVLDYSLETILLLESKRFINFLGIKQYH